MADEQPAGSDKPVKKQLIDPYRIYLKDVSFETPNSPEIFTQRENWDPLLTLEVVNTTSTITDEMYEAVLTVTATVTSNEITAFLAEVHQAGIFVLRGFDKEQLHRLHNVYCVSTLYPYAASAISDLIAKGGFPQLLLKPINIEDRYQELLQEEEKAKDDESP